RYFPGKVGPGETPGSRAPSPPAGWPPPPRWRRPSCGSPPTTPASWWATIWSSTGRPACDDEDRASPYLLPRSSRGRSRKIRASKQQPGARSFRRQFVVGVSQRAVGKREAAAADALVELVSQPDQLGDAFLQVGFPRGGQPGP